MTIRVGLDQVPARTQVLVVGLGVTGAGVALDAASRGLDVLAVDAHDLAFGTSRWSSKMVHGGLRYLAKGQVGIARESAVERGILMETTAPHLVSAIPMLMPLTDRVSSFQTGLTAVGFRAGDVLRRTAHTSGETLPGPRRITTTEALRLAPGLRLSGLRGGLLTWDGRVEDDARLVTTIARTAAQHGARVHTRVRVEGHDDGVVALRDTRSGATSTINADVVINASGVWAGGLDPQISLRPSRGTHVVLGAATLPGLGAIVTAPVPGSVSRYVMLLPQSDGTVHVGLTDEPAPGPIPDVPEPTPHEIGFLLDVASSVLDRPLRPDDVAGAYAGLRPLLELAGTASSADLSRRHAVLTSPGLVSVVGGKLTTYRRMAQDAVDAAVDLANLAAGPCRTTTLPLVGAADRVTLAGVSAPRRLVRRYGTDAPLVIDSARDVTGLSVDELLAPIAADVATCLAELVFGVTHEGASTVADLLDRRTRVGLIAEHRAVAVTAAERALSLARTAPVVA